MPRLRPTIAIAASASLALAVVTPTVLAQDDGRSASGGNPNIGSWIVDPDVVDPDNLPGLTTLHADGTVRDFAPDGPGFGSWQPTGDRGAESTILYPQRGEAGEWLGFVTVRASGEVSEDGQVITGTYTVEFPDGPGGMFPPAGVEYGPAEFSGVRVSVESMGDAVGPIPEPPVGITAALFENAWTTEDGRFVTEWQADGSYVVTSSAGSVQERGQSDIEGDVLTFRASGGLCDGQDGSYRVVLEGPDRFIWELVDDACGERVPFVDGVVNVRTTE